MGETVLGMVAGLAGLRYSNEVVTSTDRETRPLFFFAWGGAVGKAVELDELVEFTSLVQPQTKSAK